MRYFLLFGALVAVAVVGIAGLRGSKSRKPPIYIFADMKRQPKLRPQTSDGFFADGLSSRLPVPGTIPRSAPMHVGNQLVYLWQDCPVTTGRVTGTTNFLETNPVPVTQQLLHRGQQVFNINCAACHSQVGDGNGVPHRINAMPVIGNLHDKRIVELTDGEIFHTISYGKNLMPGYAANIPVMDRWAVIAYVRALQLSWLGDPSDVPAAERANLKQ